MSNNEERLLILLLKHCSIVYLFHKKNVGKIVTEPNYLAHNSHTKKTVSNDSSFANT